MYFSIFITVYFYSNDDFASSKEASPLSYFQEDESTRAWGDELSGDLLYTIILRRVRYSKNSDEGLQWETQKVCPDIFFPSFLTVFFFAPGAAAKGGKSGAIGRPLGRRLFAWRRQLFINFFGDISDFCAAPAGARHVA